MKIYTYSGDDGKTGLAGGQRVHKTDIQIAAVGGLDELNAHLGVVRSLGVREDLDQMLQDIQSRLFDLGAMVAADSRHQPSVSISEQDVVAMERLIDILEEELKPLQKFILPSGEPVAAQTHLARAVCRRVEREMLLLQTETFPHLAPVFKYLNRLSDLLFVLARTFNAIQNTVETAFIR